MDFDEHLLGNVFGLAVIFFLMYEPQGLAQIWSRVKSYWTLWPYSY
jgi:branched-chain amino acid transport system permease protein